MQELTKAEEQVMQVLWEAEKGFVKDLIAQMPEPKPKYNTVSTIIRILETKGFVDHKAYGKTHEYFPTVSKEDYSNYYLKSFMGRYFGGSFKQMVSFFVKENNMDLKTFEELQAHLNEEDSSENDHDKPQYP